MNELAVIIYYGMFTSTNKQIKLPTLVTLIHSIQAKTQDFLKKNLTDLRLETLLFIR